MSCYQVDKSLVLRYTQLLFTKNKELRWTEKVFYSTRKTLDYTPKKRRRKLYDRRFYLTLRTHKTFPKSLNNHMKNRQFRNGEDRHNGLKQFCGSQIQEWNMKNIKWNMFYDEKKSFLSKETMLSLRPQDILHSNGDI